MRFAFACLACILLASLLSACTPVGASWPGMSRDPAADPALGQGDYAGAPPAHGGVISPDRAARRAYYRGPRGHEF
ncbi:MAG: hypothetical protein P1U75_08475 [Antarcticimicrobium sp.]|uniref:hypothetical protein n=1 Tax=Antarcticimicrobium sp. TaxID=2824147 RepID=UPI002633806E|nr:hypothetical protein [Antarcticimicrobium sp.]MDF1716686.1 hypothetical protein [Antarcticimicrobium sp.]